MPYAHRMHTLHIFFLFEMAFPFQKRDVFLKFISKTQKTEGSMQMVVQPKQTKEGDQEHVGSADFWVHNKFNYQRQHQVKESAMLW